MEQMISLVNQNNCYDKIEFIIGDNTINMISEHQSMKELTKEEFINTLEDLIKNNYWYSNRVAYAVVDRILNS